MPTTLVFITQFRVLDFKGRGEKLANISTVAAEEAHKKIEAMPKGMPRLEAWLGAMGEELSKRGIEV